MKNKICSNEINLEPCPDSKLKIEFRLYGKDGKMLVQVQKVTGMKNVNLLSKSRCTIASSES
jgi:hypothetical protein